MRFQAQWAVEEERKRLRVEIMLDDPRKAAARTVSPFSRLTRFAYELPYFFLALFA